MDSHKIILIFGATGNIGVYLTEWLCNYLPKDEYEVIAVGRRSTSFFSQFGIEYIQMDVGNKESYSLLPQYGVYAAIHLANALPARMRDYNPEEYIKTNTLGTLYMLEYLRNVGADRILFTQTYADLAGHWGKVQLLSNSLPRKLKYTGDHAVYAISKCAAIDLMEHYKQEYGLKNFVFRLPNIYMYSPERYYFVDGKETLISYRYLIERAIKGLPIEVWGDQSIERDIVYVKDLCQMLQLGCVCKGLDGGMFNVGTGVGVTMIDQIKGIIEVFSPLGEKHPLLMCPEKRNSMGYIMDIDDAKKLLGYVPKYDYLEYLRDYKKEMSSDRFKGL